MKKLVVMMAFLTSAAFTFGQSLDDINDMLGKSEYRKAKEGIDKFLSDPKNAAKPDGWYFKGRVYNSLSKETSVLPAEAYKLKVDAFEAFKKYQVLDPKDIRFKLENYASYIDLYNGLFDVGAADFEKKDFTSAAEAFKSALVVEDYARGKGYEYNGFRFPVLDTSLILNVAIALKQAGKMDDAVGYYRKLTDANINKEQYKDVYVQLVDYYYTKGDNANMQAIMEKGKQLYPGTDWAGIALEMDLEKLSKIENKDELLGKYAELTKTYPSNYYVFYNYSTEMYNYLYASENKPGNPDAINAALNENLKNAIALAPEDKKIDANMLMARFLYNYAIDLDDSSRKYNNTKGTKPEILKKKADFKAAYNKKFDELIPYAETSINYFAGLPKLKATQKANYKIMLDILNQVYASKGNMTKAAEYEKKKDEVDKM